MFQKADRKMKVTVVFALLGLSLQVAAAAPAPAPAPMPAPPFLATNSAPDLNTIADQIFQIFAGATKFTHDQEIKANPNQPAPIMKRPVFSKSHGCLEAVFTRAADLPPDLRVGVFAAESYPAWVRFSNDGAPGPDTVPMAQGGNPARGMAIKLIGVPGPKLLPGQETALTQDSLLENNPAFFSANAADFLAFNQDFDGFLKTHPHEGQILNDIQTAQLADPLAGTYWTPTPVRLGEQRKMKYLVKPCLQEHKWNNMTGDNYLHDNLVAHLAAAKNAGDLCMDFYIQLYKDDTSTPIDDATVAWSEVISPPIHAARITFNPGQNIDTPARTNRCESLSFNLWHASAAHEPLGSLNAVRKIVYQKINDMRKTYNNSNGHPMPTAEPTTLTDDVSQR